MNRILIIGDSSIPLREELSYPSTYSSLLKKEFQSSLIEVSSKTGSSLRRIYIDLEQNIVVVNYGIVDVYPRSYPNSIYKLLTCSGLLPDIEYHYIEKASTYLATKIKKLVT